MLKRNKIALGIFAFFYISYGLVLTLMQESIIYQPWPQDFTACSALADATAVTHNGTRMYVEHGERGLVVLYHGNAGSACDRAFYVREFQRAGFGYVLVEYAGYSNDERKPTHDLIKQDVRNVVSYLQDHPAPRTVVVGESIGTGAASLHTALQAPDHLVLIAPFASLSDMAQRKFWFYPSRWLVDNAFDNVSLLQTYQGPVTIIHGDNDMIIAQKSGLLLFEQLTTTQKEFVSLSGYGHNDLFMSPEPFLILGMILREPQPSPTTSSDEV
jgi:pimeloyl-ACP methyl ester carboxylesterase